MRVSAFVIVLAMSASLCLGQDEQKCGNVFELLENYLKTQQKQETKLETFEKTIKQLENTVNFVKQRAEEELETIIDRVNEIETDAEIKIADELAILETQKQELQEASKTPTVFFTAKHIIDPDVVRDKVIQFTTVVNNEGGGQGAGYNPHTGYFTAPHAGLYMFHANICSIKKKGVYVRIMMENTALSSTEKYHDVTGGTCTSMSGVTSMEKGERAYVMGAYPNDQALYTSTQYSWPSFSGALIHL